MNKVFDVCPHCKTKSETCVTCGYTEGRCIEEQELIYVEFIQMSNAIQIKTKEPQDSAFYLDFALTYPDKKRPNQCLKCGGIICKNCITSIPGTCKNCNNEEGH